MKRYVRSAMYAHDDYSDLDAFSANRFDRCTVARNTDDLELMEVYAFDPDSLVKANLLENPNLTLDTFNMMVDTLGQTVLVRVATSTKTPPEILSSLLGHSDFEVRVRAAGNESTPIDSIAAHIQDKAVLRGVADNSNRNLFLDALMTSEDPYVLSKLAKSTKTPREVLERLAQHSNTFIRYTAIKTLRNLDRRRDQRGRYTS